MLIGKQVNEVDKLSHLGIFILPDDQVSSAVSLRTQKAWFGSPLRRRHTLRL